MRTYMEIHKDSVLWGNRKEIDMKTSIDANTFPGGVCTEGMIGRVSSNVLVGEANHQQHTNRLSIQSLCSHLSCHWLVVRVKYPFKAS